MTVDEIAEGIQFTVDHNGQITGVVVEPKLWQRIVEALEDGEDRALIQMLHTRLQKGPIGSGALRWQDVADQWQ
jgi:hypothetical protein